MLYLLSWLETRYFFHLSPPGAWWQVLYDDWPPFYWAALIILSCQINQNFKGGRMYKWWLCLLQWRHDAQKGRNLANRPANCKTLKQILFIYIFITNIFRQQKQKKKGIGENIKCAARRDKTNTESQIAVLQITSLELI